MAQDGDKYMKAPCETRKWVVLQLSEDIMIDHVILANLEHYSSSAQVPDPRQDFWLVNI